MENQNQKENVLTLESEKEEQVFRLHKEPNHLFNQEIRGHNVNPNKSLFDQLLESSEQQDYIPEVFSQQKYLMVEKTNNQIGKVTNQPKHYFRKFVNNYEKFLEKDLYAQDQKRRLKRVVHSLTFLSNSNSKKLTMKNLLKLLTPGAIIDEEIAMKNRQVFSQILKSDLCENSKEENRKLHMIASRIYALRCRNAELAQRNTIH